MRLCLVLACVCFSVPLQAQPPVRFDDSAADRLRIDTDAYMLALSKTNGAILSLIDKSAAASLTLGSRGGCLWGSNYQASPTPYRGGCSFAAGKSDAFTYNWDASQGVLTLQYNSATASAQRLDVTVSIAFQPAWFDMNLSLANHMGVTLSSILFPSDLLFADNSIEAGYLPYYLPGVRLRPAFFTGNRSISVIYPGARAFADYYALEAAGGRMAVYAVNPAGRVAPAAFGFQDDEKTRAGTFYAFHTFQEWVPDGGSVTTPTVRVQPGASIADTIALYRSDNGIDGYPSLSDKLGDFASTLAAAPLVKMDLRSIGRSFADLIPRLDLIRAPALLRPVSYWPRAFDQNYPDFLPPDPRFGSMDDFRGFVQAAHARGLLVMPYTNPTWWDDQSPTAQAAANLADLAVLTSDGNPVYETYGPNRGFVASSYSPAVEDRLSSLMAQWANDVPVDLVFQDQIGSRSWLRDFNPAAPDPMSYSDGWLQFTGTYSGSNLMTEDGWDRIAATEIGFAGSALTGTTAWNPAQVAWGQGSRGNTAFGAGMWEPYPLGVWLFHDKVLFYQHDLDDLPMNAGVEVLTWNAAFGVMAGYYWPELRSPNPDWAGIAAAFQPAVLSRAAGRVLSGYTSLAAGVTESRFEDLDVIANWNADSTYSLDGYTIAASGCLARTGDRAVIGGVFQDEFNGAALSPGVHYLLVQQFDGAIAVRQPSGPDTPVTIQLPDGWDAAAVGVRAMSRENQALAQVPFTVEGGRVTFSCAAGVDHYEIR